MTETKLRPIVFKHIEAELYDYPDTKKDIKRLREQILAGTPQDDENVGGGRSNVPGRPTERIATRLVTDRRLQYLEGMAIAIERAFNQVPEECKCIVQLKYWSHRRLTWDGIAEESHVSRASALRYRRQFINLVAEKLAWK